MEVPIRRFIRPALVALVLALAIGAPANANRRAQFPVQSLGDRGADVVTLQHLLRSRGRSLVVSGSYGSGTRSAVMSFQESRGLNTSGVAFVSTWEALVPLLRQGSRGEAVIALKKQLNAKYRAELPLSSTFNAATRIALRDFQRHVGLSASGVADRTTWRNLIWHYMRPDFSTAGLCNYNGGSTRADWGTAAAIAHLEAAATTFRQRTGGRVAVGDISFEHGGDINLHATHEDGLDIDIALIRTDGRQCSVPGIAHTSARYDRADTRQLLRTIHETLGGHLKLIYFNDPVLIREGLARRYPHHDDHIHVRLCEPDHDRAEYVC